MISMRGAVVMLVAMVGACGGGDGEVDAPPGIDARPGDGRAVVAELRVPTTTAEVTQYGLDLDELPGDGVDNQLGTMLASLALTPALDLQGLTTYAIDHGTLSWLVDLEARHFDNATGVTLHGFRGTAPMPAPCADASDPVCRHHLAGTGAFQLQPTTPADQRVVGRIIGRRFDGKSGQFEVPLIFASTEPVWMPLQLPHARLNVAADGLVMTGAIGGAVRQADLEALVIPAIADGVRASFAADCPGTVAPSCGCTAGSRGAALRDLFDLSPTADCAITTAEVRATFGALLAPDVDVDHDGTSDAVSIGLGVSTMPATF